MKHLIIDINEITKLRNIYQDEDFDPTRFALLCEIAGAHGISVSLGNQPGGINERDIRLLKDLHNSYLNLHIPAQPEQAKLALPIRPEMITFVDLKKSAGKNEFAPFEPEGLYQIAEFLSDFHANNISIAALIQPEINTLKQLSKMEIDYAEFECNQLANSNDTNEEMVELDRLKSAILGASKLGLGVNCYGGIKYNHLPALAAIPQLEDITMGLSVVKRSLEVGINSAIKEALQQILAYHRD